MIVCCRTQSTRRPALFAKESKLNGETPAFMKYQNAASLKENGLI